ncbi:uncharacterized protein N7459_007553 [Penicillium hispanicum]|uniref:uncharacterized protein n=1 Tax=Penicillium hispanicum TaxID=1080232 RepID=UPI00253F9C62|nr:uncharacterized protein N7459_007553 [Penicillium hispanicum]KAJ5578589.1 hypothetical protein N7459_007553 [Penicillium hispanicum]
MQAKRRPHGCSCVQGLGASTGLVVDLDFVFRAGFETRVGDVLEVRFRVGKRRRGREGEESEIAKVFQRRQDRRGELAAVMKSTPITRDDDREPVERKRQ